MTNATGALHESKREVNEKVFKGYTLGNGTGTWYKNELHGSRFKIIDNPSDHK